MVFQALKVTRALLARSVHQVRLETMWWDLQDHLDGPETKEDLEGGVDQGHLATPERKVSDTVFFYFVFDNA